MDDKYPSPDSWLQLDSFLLLNSHFINHVKRQARKLSKSKLENLSRSESLDKVSNSFGFRSWRHLLNRFHYESDSDGWVSYTESDKIFSFYTERQLHGAVYRYLAIQPHSQVIQFVIGDTDYDQASDLWYGSNKDIFEILLTQGVVPDYGLQNFLTESDPFFHPDYGIEVRAYRFIYEKNLSHQQASNILHQTFLDLGLVGFGLTCYPMFIWLDGKLSDDISPPDEGLGDDSLPLMTLPKEICRRVYE